MGKGLAVAVGLSVGRVGVGVLQALGVLEEEGRRDTAVEGERVLEAQPQALAVLLFTIVHVVGRVVPLEETEAVREEEEAREGVRGGEPVTVFV